MAVPDGLLDRLRCVECHETLDDQGVELVCTGCGLRYPVTDGIPIMLIEAALPAEDA